MSLMVSRHAPEQQHHASGYAALAATQPCGEEIAEPARDDDPQALCQRIRAHIEEGWRVTTDPVFTSSPASRRQRAPPICFFLAIFDVLIDLPRLRDLPYEDAIRLLGADFSQSAALSLPFVMFGDSMRRDAMLTASCGLAYLTTVLSIPDDDEVNDLVIAWCAPMFVLVMILIGVQGYFTITFACVASVAEMMIVTDDLFSLVFQAMMLSGIAVSAFAYDRQLAILVKDGVDNRVVAERLLDSATDGFCTVQCSTGRLLSASGKLQRTIGGLAHPGQLLPDWMSPDCREQAKSMLAGHTDEHMEPALVTCRLPGPEGHGDAETTIEVDVRLVPYSVREGRLSFCVQVVGERRQVTRPAKRAEPFRQRLFDSAVQEDRLSYTDTSISHRSAFAPSAAGTSELRRRAFADAAVQTSDRARADAAVQTSDNRPGHRQRRRPQTGPQSGHSEHSSSTTEDSLAAQETARRAPVMAAAAASRSDQDVLAEGSTYAEDSASPAAATGAAVDSFSDQGVGVDAALPTEEPSISVQAAAGIGSDYDTLPRAVEVGSDLVAERHARSSASSSLPPRLPGDEATRALAGRSRSPSSVGSSRSSRRSHRSRGRSSRTVDGPPVVSQFATTDPNLAAHSLMWLLRHWNLPRNQLSCCHKHAQIAGARQVIKGLSEGLRCDPLWSPHTSWQCSQCSCVNPAATCCEVCAQPQAPTEETE